MADSNRVRFAEVPETTVGTLPATPRFRTISLTGESLKYSPTFFTPNTMRADRMNIAPTPINDQNSGGINFECIYPESPRYLHDFYSSALQNPWLVNAERYNDGTAASVITAVSATTFTVTTGAAFVVGQLLWSSGFAAAANNGINIITTGGTTSVVCAGGGFTVDASPAGTARIKDVGFQGGLTDIGATTTGLSSATLDFTTLGLVVGQWIEIGGAGAAFQFAAAANRGYARINTIAAHALTLDNLPTGWTVEAASGAKTIRVFYGDILRNGTIPLGMSVERSYLDQTTPSYILQTGMVVDTMTFTAVTEAAVLQTVTFMGMHGTDGTVANGTTYDTAPNERVFTANVSVGRITEGIPGVTVTTPNFARQMDWTINNNLRMDTALGTRGAIRIGSGDALVTGTLSTYFGNNVLLDKIRAGTVTSLSAKVSAANAYDGNIGLRAVVWSFPQVTFTGGDPTATGKNVSIVIPMTWQSSVWSDPSAPAAPYAPTYEMQVDRFPYVEETG